MINLQMKVMLQLMNLSSPKFLKKAPKNTPPYFFHRLYGVDAPLCGICRMRHHFGLRLM